MWALAEAVQPLTWDRLLTSWRLEPGVLAAVVVLAAGYGFGVRGWRRRGEKWPPGRTVCFAAGVMSIALVGLSFIGVYADTLFWVRAVQNIVLLMVTPMLLALGAPLTLLREVLPVRRRARLSKLLHSGPARLLSYPLVVTMVLVLPLLVLYLTSLYELTLRSTLASGLAGLTVATAGFVYFWTRFRIDPTPRAGSHGITLVITIVEMIADAVLGVVLWLGPIVASDYYAGLGRQWGPSLYTDQLLGAGVLWVGGDVVGLPFILIVVGRMIREDEAHAVQIDAELDALDQHHTTAAANPDQATGNATTGAISPEHRPARLWWEDDPQLAERFRRG